MLVIDHYSEDRIYTVKRTMSESPLELTGHMPTYDLILNHENEYDDNNRLLSLNVQITIGQILSSRGRRGRDRMVVGFTTIYEISAYHHCCCEFESRSGRGVQNYVITLVSDLRQVNGFLRVIRFPPPIKLTATI